MFRNHTVTLEVYDTLRACFTHGWLDVRSEVNCMELWGLVFYIKFATPNSRRIVNYGFNCDLSRAVINFPRNGIAVLGSLVGSSGKTPCVGFARGSNSCIPCVVRSTDKWANMVLHKNNRAKQQPPRQADNWASPLKSVKCRHEHNTFFNLVFTNVIGNNIQLSMCANLSVFPWQRCSNDWQYRYLYNCTVFCRQ